MKLSEIAKQRKDIPSGFMSQVEDPSQMATSLPALFNSLLARRAIIPAANLHCSARALARYYAALVDQGSVPPPHSSSTQPRLGTHIHMPQFPSKKPTKKGKSSKLDVVNTDSGKNYTKVPTDDTRSLTRDGFVSDRRMDKLFINPRIHDAFLGVGEYEDLTLPGGLFGLGFKRSYSKGGELIGFGHSGMGGSTGYSDMKHRFAIAVTLNKMNFGGVTAQVMQLVCSELNIPLPADYYKFTERLSDDESNVAMPLIN